MTPTDNQPPKLTHNDLSEIETCVHIAINTWRNTAEALDNGDEVTLEEVSLEWDIADDDGEYSLDEAKKRVACIIIDNQSLLARVQELQRYCEQCGQKRDLYYIDDRLLCEECSEKYERFCS